MAAKKTATKATATAPKKGVDVDFLNSFTSTLDEVLQYANGYGSLKSAVIVAEDNGTEVTATYDGRSWSLSFLTHV